MRLVADHRNRPKARRVFSPSNSVVEFIAGPFVECVERIWEAKLGEYLSASDARRHLWHACLASGLPTFRPRSAAAAKRSYDRLTYAPGKELAAQAYGECPPGLLRSLGRLGAEPRRPEIYRALVQILQRGGPSAKAVMHSAQLSDELIRALATLPTGMASKRAIGLVVRGHISPGDLATFGWTLSRIRQLKDLEAYERVLASADPLAAVVNLLLDADFPAAPWPGTHLLKPVTSRVALHRIGVELRNCLEAPRWLARSVLKVLNGTDYFYVWRGEQPALLQFVRLLDVGWYLEQIEGFHGDGVSETTQTQILATCSGSAVMCACEPTGIESAFREKLLGAMA
jgi:hypothetical protein